MKAFDALKIVSRYPVPVSVVEATMLTHGIDKDADMDVEMANASDFRLCRADIMMWLSTAPNISQGGQTYSFSEFERKQFRMEAQAIYGELDPSCIKTKYGYKGRRI